MVTLGPGEQGAAQDAGQRVSQEQVAVVPHGAETERNWQVSTVDRKQTGRDASHTLEPPDQGMEDSTSQGDQASWVLFANGF